MLELPQVNSHQILFIFFTLMPVFTLIFSFFSLKIFRLPRTAAGICSCLGHPSWIHLFLSRLMDCANFSTVLGDFFFPSVHWFQHIESSEFPSHFRCGNFHSQSLMSHPAFTPYSIQSDWKHTHWKHMQCIHLILGILVSFFQSQLHPYCVANPSLLFWFSFYSSG